MWNYQYYNSNPDGVNSIYPLLPGTGTVLGSPDSGGIRRYAFSINGTLRSTLTDQSPDAKDVPVSRWTWYLMKPGVVRQIAEQTTDEGAHWVTTWDSTYSKN